MLQDVLGRIRFQLKSEEGHFIAVVRIKFAFGMDSVTQSVLHHVSWCGDESEIIDNTKIINILRM